MSIKDAENAEDEKWADKLHDINDNMRRENPPLKNRGRIPTPMVFMRLEDPRMSLELDGDGMVITRKGDHYSLHLDHPDAASLWRLFGMMMRAQRR